MVGEGIAVMRGEEDFVYGIVIGYGSDDAGNWVDAVTFDPGKAAPEFSSQIREGDSIGNYTSDLGVFQPIAATAQSEAQREAALTAPIEGAQPVPIQEPVGQVTSPPVPAPSPAAPAAATTVQPPTEAPPIGPASLSESQQTQEASQEQRIADLENRLAEMSADKQSDPEAVTPPDERPVDVSPPQPMEQQ